MKPSVIAQILSRLEKLVQTEFESGVEFWLARDLQGVLGYTNWQNFCKVVESAATACKTSGHKASDHFTEVSKMIAHGKGEHTRPRVLSLAPSPRTVWKQGMRCSTRNLIPMAAPADFWRGRQKLRARALALPSVARFVHAKNPKILMHGSIAAPQLTHESFSAALPLVLSLAS
jgi:hypothetical protein